MKNIRILFLACWAAVSMLSACQSDGWGKRYRQDGLIFTEELEAVKGRADVYQSMARAVKYNVDNASLNLNKKIFTQDPNQEPKRVLKNIMNAEVDDHMPLFEASNVLEYAIIYGISHLQESQPAAEMGLYLKSSQHLALAAIRSHQSTWFAMRKIKEIDRILKRENKNLATVKQKLEQQGYLSEADLDYKKNLEVSLLKLNEIRNALVFSQEEFSQLIKANSQTVELEGRRFYELDDFDKKYNLDIFQESAVRNRSEFAAIRDKNSVKYYSFEEVRDHAIRDYPEIVRLEINGVSMTNELYEKELKERAFLIANNLIDSVIAYQTATSLFKEQLRKKAFDELGAAILAQIQINYCMVKLADLEYMHLEREIAKQKKEVAQAEKNMHGTNVQKLILLNQQIKLIELQRRQTMISGERAVALRSLYFNAGLSPFSKKNLKLSLGEIVKLLKTSFNKDLVEMLSAASVEIKKLPKPKKNDWAKEDDWLETLMKQPYKKVVVKKETPAQKTIEPIKDGKRLQLGAYMDKKNLYKDWDKMSEQLPELKEYSIQMEPAEVSGVMFWRLLISPTKDQLQPLCQKLVKEGFGCLVR